MAVVSVNKRLILSAKALKIKGYRLNSFAVLALKIQL
jgi:hypothetical protein